MKKPCSSLLTATAVAFVCCAETVIVPKLDTQLVSDLMELPDTNGDESSSNALTPVLSLLSAYQPTLREAKERLSVLDYMQDAKEAVLQLFKDYEENRMLLASNIDRALQEFVRRIEDSGIRPPPIIIPSEINPMIQLIPAISLTVPSIVINSGIV